MRLLQRVSVVVYATAALRSACGRSVGLSQRYASWDSALGKKIEANKCTFDELEKVGCCLRLRCALRIALEITLLKCPQMLLHIMS